MNSILSQRILKGKWQPTEFDYHVHSPSKVPCNLELVRDFLKQRGKDVSVLSISDVLLFPNLRCAAVVGTFSFYNHLFYAAHFFNEEGKPYDLRSIYNRTKGEDFWKEVEFDKSTFSTHTIYTRGYQQMMTTMCSQDTIVGIKYEVYIQRLRKAQKACHNWLFAPKCRDGTIGIVPRLAMRKLCEKT